MSLTAGERRALSWLLAVIMIGAGVRVVRYWRHADSSMPGANEALARQLLSIDSAQRVGRRARSGRREPRPSDSGRRRRASRRSAGSGPDESGVSESAAAGASTSTERPRLGIVDVDVADSALLERLPRIGPALAARIVADRSAHGSFGSLQGLERVRGIGPGLARALAAHVTFSGIRRPSAVQR